MTIQFSPGTAQCFIDWVTNELSKLAPLKCDDDQCKYCADPTSPQIELSHYSRDGVKDWREVYRGNYQCWSEWVSDHESVVARITDQPGREYKQLCLIKFVDCQGIDWRRRSGENNEHIAIYFGVPGERIAKLPLTATGPRGNRVYACPSSPANAPPADAT